jgi:hypothetical protein
MLAGMLITLLLNLVTLGSAGITEVKYTVCVKCQFIGPTLLLLQDVRRIMCAASCRELMECDVFQAGPDNSCQLFGAGYVIDDPNGDNYYLSNGQCEYELDL